jgi:tRNA 2-thiocytidine biosynthesis protein TtcA
MINLQMTAVNKNKDTKLFRHLKKWLEKVILDYKMIEEGDKVLIGVSGGADSLALLDLLDSPMIFTPSFSFIAVNIDMGFDPTYQSYEALEKYFQENDYRYVMEKTDIGNLAHSDFNKKNPCFLCSRLRRKRIFEIADAEGCNKIAFAHHRDDIIETLLINMFYGREISTMMPNQKIFSGKLHIIRPLAYLREELVKKYSKERQFPVLKNDCPTSLTSKRVYVKNLLNELERDNKEIRDNIYKAMSHVKPDYLLPKK